MTTRRTPRAIWNMDTAKRGNYESGSDYVLEYGELRFTFNERDFTERVVKRRIARTIESLMLDVVAYGTGTAAALPGVKVAGKTGTAELEDTRDPETGETQPSDPSNTDAWFAAYAPAGHPKIAVAVMLVRAGAGGATAAPAARVVLDAAL